MTSRAVIALVSRREIGDRIRHRGFLIGTVVTLVLVLMLVIAPSLAGGDGPTTYQLGVVGGDPIFADVAVAAAQARDAELVLTPVADRAEAEAAVGAGELDAALLDGDRLLFADDPDAALEAIVEQARQQAALVSELAGAGLDPQEVASVLSGRAPVEIVTLRGSQEEAEQDMALAFITTILLFVIVQINGAILLTGAIEEKSSRVVEVLLATLRPWQLLAGKLIGFMVLAMGQLVLFVGVTLGLNEIIGAFDVPDGTASAVATAATMLVLGFAFYAALYAVAGSMASSLEDAQAAAGPLGFLTVGAYAGTLLGVVPDPDSALATVLTFVPPTAPFAVPARVAVGSISTAEVVLAAALTGVTAVLTVRLAGRLYSATILSGGKLKWRDVLRAEPIT